MKLYHGTPEIVQPPWSLDHLGKTQKHKPGEPGIYWTPDPVLATEYGDEVYCVDVDVDVLIRRTDLVRYRAFSYVEDCMEIMKRAPRWNMVLSGWGKGRARAYRALKDAISREDDPVEMLIRTWCEAYSGESEMKAFLETAVDHGHRGILIKENHPEGDPPIVVIFDPTLLDEARLLTPDELDEAIKNYQQ